MEVIIDKNKLKSCIGHGLGALVTLKQDLSASPLVVVGHCACVEAKSTLKKLETLSLPTPSWSDTVEVARALFPGGCEVGKGLWVCVESKITAHQIWGTLRTETDVMEVLQPVLVVMMSSNGSEVNCFSIDSDGHILSTEHVQTVSTSTKNYLEDNTVLCRLLTSMPLCVLQDQPVAEVLSSIEHFINAQSTVFSAPSKPSLVFSESTPVDIAAQKLLKARSATLTSLPSSAHHLAHSETGPVPISLLTDHSVPGSSGFISISKPLSALSLKISLSLDVLVLARVDSPLRLLASALKEKVTNHLKRLARSIEWKDGCISTVKTHHVALWNQHVPVCVVYPHTVHQWEEFKPGHLITTNDCQPFREELHTRLCLSTNLPYLRVPIQPTTQGSPWLSSNTALSTGPQLLNPHLHLKQSAKEGSLATVQGDYLYYHYMQGGFNDKGWGCAYRSLQTLWSWFWLQGYTAQPPPTHHEIQESIVATKSRSSSLIGSKEWIGSYEVSNSLDQLLGVTCKIKDSVEGSNMDSIGRLLLEHFRGQGTPVMIGGGLLAHTLLGVNFNEVTGDTQFLVLDPHYTGREDIKTITDKGKWCGWKQVSFWSPKAVYNLCMPQRPLSVI